MSAELKKCPRCGTTNPGAHTFCYRCGETLPEALPPQCPSCGAEIPSHEFAYCPRCGVQLGQAGSSTSQPGGLYPASQSQSYAESFPAGISSSGIGSQSPDYEAEPSAGGIQYVRPRRESRRGILVGIVAACAVVALVLVLAIVPLRTVTDPGSTSPFNSLGQATSVEGYTLYLANLTFTARTGASVQLTWATNHTEVLCAVGIGGPAAGSGAWVNEGSDVCSGAHNFTSQGGTFYFAIDSVASFTVSGSVTLGSTTSRAPIL